MKKGKVKIKNNFAPASINPIHAFVLTDFFPFYHFSQSSFLRENDINYFFAELDVKITIL